MTVLLLRLAGPLQAWGDSSRFTRRETRQEPTKSGVIGLLAAADGRRRSDPIEDLAALTFGIRIDQPGRLVRDFQTARSMDGTRTMPLSFRYYLSDAIFVAAVHGDQTLLEGLLAALQNPTFPLFLGRRSCPPAGPVALGLRDGDVTQALHAEPWQAAHWYRRRQAFPIDLPVVQDGGNYASASELVHDQPVSYDPARRVHDWRAVIRSAVRITEDGTMPPSSALRSSTHEPMAAFGGN